MASTQVARFTEECKKGILLFTEKNEDYGNNFELYGLMGVTFEIIGALGRLPKLVLWSPDHGASRKEKLIDIFRDIHNYANMALMVIEQDNWDGRSKE